MDELNLSDMNWCKREIDSLRQQLAAAEAAMQEVGNVRLQLAAALAAVEAKDNILVSIAERWNRDENEEAMKDACWYALNAADDALAIKPDASALKAHDEALIERIAQSIEQQRNDIPACGFEFAATIRELKGTL